MVKIIVIVALICFTTVLAGRGPGRDSGEQRPGGGNGQRPRPTDPIATICANSTLPSAFLTGALGVVSTLQSNGSYTETLSKLTNTVNYLNSNQNQALLSVNCTEYFAGFQRASQADKAALEAQAKLLANAISLFENVLRTVSGVPYRGPGGGHH